MSDENNIFDNNDTQYTPAPEVTPGEPAYSEPVYSEPTYSEPVYSGEPVNYDSGKGKGQGLGIASMICGILSLIGCCGIYFISIPLALAAIILGIIQIVKNESKGMAIAGIICGGIGLVISIIVLIMVIVMVSSGAYQDMMQEIMNEAGMSY